MYTSKNCCLCKGARAGVLVRSTSCARVPRLPRRPVCRVKSSGEAREQLLSMAVNVDKFKGIPIIFRKPTPGIM